MSIVRTLAALLAVAPAAALAQISITEVRILPAETLPLEARMACIDRVNDLHERRARLGDQRYAVELENQAIARGAEALAEELRRLDSRDPVAVADYNARQAAHNRQVQLQAERVANLNARAADFNADTADAMRFCEAT